MIPREDMILIFDVKKESLVFVFSAAAELVESRVNGPGARFNKEVQPTLSLNLNSEMTYSEMGNSEFSVSERLNCVSSLNSK